jgi:hypothetical protein
MCWKGCGLNQQLRKPRALEPVWTHHCPIQHLNPPLLTRVSYISQQVTCRMRCFIATCMCRVSYSGCYGCDSCQGPLHISALISQSHLEPLLSAGIHTAVTARHSRVFSTPAWYSGGPGTNLDLGTSYPEIFVIFLSPCRHMPG